MGVYFESETCWAGRVFFRTLQGVILGGLPTLMQHMNLLDVKCVGLQGLSQRAP